MQATIRRGRVEAGGGVVVADALLQRAGMIGDVPQGKGGFRIQDMQMVHLRQPGQNAVCGGGVMVAGQDQNRNRCKRLEKIRRFRHHPWTQGIVVEQISTYQQRLHLFPAGKIQNSAHHLKSQILRLGAVLFRDKGQRQAKLPVGSM